MTKNSTLSTQESKNRRYAYVIVACSFLTMLLSDYSAYQLPPISHLIMAELNIGDAEFSKLFTASMIPGVLLCLVAGILCDKFGTKICIGIAIAISAVGIIGRVFATDFNSMYLSMVSIGVVATFISANVAKIVVNWVEPRKMGLMVGIVLAGGPTAMTIAMATTALFPSIRAVFLTSAALSVLVFVLWVLFMKNKPKNTMENESIAQELKEQPLAESLGKVIKHKQVWLVGFCYGFILSAAVCTSTFLPIALQVEKDLDPVVAGGMTAFIMVGNIAGSIIGPIICFKIGRVRPYLFTASIIMAIGVAFSWEHTNGIALGICLFITGFACSAVMSQLTSITVMLKGIGPKLAGTAGGFVGTIRMLFCLIVPAHVIAPLADGNYSLLFLLTGILPAIAAILSLRIPEVLSLHNKETN